MYEICDVKLVTFIHMFSSSVCLWFWFFCPYLYVTVKTLPLVHA